MFLDATLRRNRALIDAAIDLHRSGAIGSNTYVVDIDAVVGNARAIAAEARRVGLRGLHAMTKQQGRNPYFGLAALAGGIDDIVAVDVPEARLLAAHGLPMGHVGHLVQVPTRDTADVIALGPRAITVFSVEAARRLSEAALERGVRQAVLLRVWKPGDFLHPGQEGGFRFDDVLDAARSIAGLPGVSIAGVSSFPCVAVDESGGIAPTGNLTSVTMAADRLREELALELSEVNTPGATCVATLSFVAEAGGTHAEPGSGLAGNTPLHVLDQPEIPAMVYISEIAAVDRSTDRAFCFGGGFYPRSRMRRGLLFAADGERLVDAPLLPPEVIDYYGTLALDGGAADVGDSVVFAFRAQVFVGRCQVAAVGGISRGRPELLGTTDQHGNLLGDDQLPVGIDRARAIVRERWDSWVTTTALEPGR